ncbi:MAG: HNH endonuclease family protein, partial [uncultured Acidimicrobiales bacterium]
VGGLPGRAELGREGHLAPERQLRAAVRRPDEASHRAGARREGRDHRSRWRSGALGVDRPPCPLGHPAHHLRARPLPGSAAADPPRSARPRLPPVRLLQQERRHRRPRGAPLPWRPPRVGERRRRLPSVQRPQGRPPPGRARLVAADHTDSSPGHPVAGGRRRADRPGVGAVPRPSRL